MKLTDKQLEIMNAQGHLLVKGGPGSGKTTVSILKILFVSFARASTSRIMQAIEYEQNIPAEFKKHIDVETYHSFFWRIIKAHGYLVGLPRTLTILTPQNVAVALSAIRGDYAKNKVTDKEKAEKIERETAEKLRLAKEEGRICFDLFADYASLILEGSARICRLVANMHPFIILDEFQDTNAGQWRVVKQLGKYVTLYALADPEQRIYDWIGADPGRLDHFTDTFAPAVVDLSTENHRSEGTDIAIFANDMLIGKFRAEPYVGIQISPYVGNKNQAYSALLMATYRARRRLVESGKKDWSLAVLVPTKKMTQNVSDVFREPLSKMSEIRHIAALELEASILAAQIIAFLMQPNSDGSHFEQFLALLYDYFHGRGGDTITKGDLHTTRGIKNAFAEWIARQKTGKAIRQNSVLVSIFMVYEAAMKLAHLGNPSNDWMAVRSVLAEGTSPYLQAVAFDVRNLRLIERGTQLRQDLAEDWRNNGCYKNALEIIKQAFLQQYFSSNARPETGVIVMNMHKAKGKAFDEVIIFDGWPSIAKGQIIANLDRVVQSNLQERVNDESRQNFRVSITRARRRTTILTPQNDPCVLLPR
jgi:DNA helicase-2/ATP-dependent DNA helicase PcrA